MHLKHTLIAFASTTLLTTGMAHAASDTPATLSPAAKSDGQKMAQTAPNSVDRSQLEMKLRAGKNRTDYDKILKDSGYRVSAINEDKEDYLEYEVVKGAFSYEVHFDFEDGAAKASEVDVKPNIWRADATKRMVKDPSYKHAGALAADPEGRSSDRRYMKAWSDEKDRLEKSLPVNLKAADYRSKLEGMGYQVTAVNDREKDYIEYEIAKGDNSYEVQIDLDSSSGLAKKIDVTNNLWEAEATDEATDRADDMKK